MSASVVRSARVAGTTATTSVGTITAPNAGSTLLIQVAVPTANAPLTAFTDNLGNTYTQDHLQTGLNGSFSFYYFRRSNFANAPTSLSATGTTGSFSAVFSVVEVTGLDNTSPVESVINTTLLSGGVSQTAHLATYTTTNTNAFVMLGANNGNLRNLSSVTSVNMAVVADGATSQIHLAYLADAGAAGGYSSTLTFTAGCQAWFLGVIYKAAKPAVTSVSSPSVTEGGNLVFTVTLASPTSGTTGYSAALAASGTYPASLGSDLVHTLSTATHSNGVTFAAGSYSVPSSVLTWQTTIGTVDDLLDEYDETFTLTVDGTVSGTGTITDNDAPPVVTFSDGVESFGVVTCTATLGAVSGKDVSFQVDTTNGTKTAGTHYTAIVAQTVTIPAGSLTAAITVNTL